MQSTETYRYARSTRLWMYAGSILFTGGGLIAATQTLFSSLILLGFAVLSIWMSIETSSKAVVTEDGIENKKPFFRSQKVQWEKIANVQFKGFSSRLEIRSQRGNTLHLSSQLDGFNILLDSIRGHRPDLFSSPQISHFHRKKFITFLMFTCGVMMLSFAVFLPGDDWWARIILLGFALLCPIALLYEIRKVVIEETHLKLEFPFREKHILREEVEEISLEQENGRYGTRSTLIALYMHNGKRIKLSGFQEGDMEAYNALQTWLAN